MDETQSEGHHSPAVLLIHGQPGSPADWRLVYEGLGPFIEVVVPERPGYGDNPRPAGDFAHNARAMIDLLDASGIDQVVVVAHSWGGGVAMEMAINYPERIVGLVLVSSIGPGAVTVTDRLMTLPVISRVTAGLAVRLGGAALSPRVSGPVNRLLGHRVRNAARALLGRDRHRRLADTYVIEQAALVRELPDLLSRAAGITVPTKIIHARNDHLISVRVGRSLKALIASSVLTEAAHGSHYLPHRNPEVIINQIKSFVD